MNAYAAHAPGPALLIGTRKGAFVLQGDAARENWHLTEPGLRGSMVNDFACDPRDGHSQLLAAKAGHRGPTVYRRERMAGEWREARLPPAFKLAAKGEDARSVDHVFCFTPGHPDEPGSWYAGTCPVGLFRSDDGGDSWQGVAGFNEGLYPRIRDAVGEVPGGSILHSIRIDPRDPGHLYIALSTGGVFESIDRGANWHALNRGVEATFLPDPAAEYGHDPHCLMLHPRLPDRLYQQNHCGIYRLDRPGETWRRIGRTMPAEVGDIGFPLALHPREPDVLWVFPMDGSETWPRTSPGGHPALYRSADGGASWQRQANGLPAEHAWWTVRRQALATDTAGPLGLYFGTTSGEIWASADEGEHWRALALHLPEILSLAVAPPR
jgi:hypothetical protein